MYPSFRYQICSHQDDEAKTGIVESTLPESNSNPDFFTDGKMIHFLLGLGLFLGGLAVSFSPSNDLTDYFFDIAEVYLASMEGDPGCEYVAGDWCSLGFWKRRNQEEARKWLGLGDVLSHRIHGIGWDWHVYLHLPSKSTKCR